MNLGLPQLPEWLLKVILALAVFGAFALIGLLGVAIGQIIKHIHWL